VQLERSVTYRSYRQISARRLAGPRVEIPIGCRNADVAEGVPYENERRAAREGVRGVGVAEVMRPDLLADAGSLRDLLNDAPGSRSIERAFASDKNEVVG